MSEKLPRLYRVEIVSTVIVLANSAKEAEEHVTEALDEVDPDLATVTAAKVGRAGVSSKELSRKPYVCYGLDAGPAKTTDRWLTEIEEEEKQMQAEVEFQKKQIPLPFNRFKAMSVDQIIGTRDWGDAEYARHLEKFIHSLELDAALHRYLAELAYEEEVG